MLNVTNKCNRTDVNWSRFLYCGFVLLSAYYVLIPGNYGSAVTNMAIALAFDPFDQKISWENRTVWQRGLLIVHLCLVLAGFCCIK